MHEFTTAFNNELKKWENKPVELYRIYLQDGTLYLTNYPIRVRFYNENGISQEYTPVAIQRGRIKRNIDSRTDEMDLKLDNVSLAMSALFGKYNLRGIRVQVLKILLIDGYNLQPNDCKQLFNGRMDSPVLSETQLSVTVKSKLGLGKQTPGRTFARSCQVEFGSEWCGITKLAVEGTVVAVDAYGTTLTLSGRTEVEGYFVNGPIFVNGEWRRVLSSNAQTVEIDYPFEVLAVGDNYTIERRCDGTYDDCKIRFGNEANYQGFLGIPQEGYVMRRY